MACIKDWPLEREQEESRTMVACSDGAVLHCFVCAVTAKSCQLKKRKKKKKEKKKYSSALLCVSHIKVICAVLGQRVGMALILGHFINK